MDDPTTTASEGFGLMFYNARWYDVYLNHFTQPDTIIPNPGNSQDWDRYAYARNNPLKYTDPSGHEPHGPGSCYDSIDGKCSGDRSNAKDKIVVIVCGWDFDCENGNPSESFAQLVADLGSQGYDVSFFNTVKDGDKTKTKDAVAGYLASIGLAYDEVHMIGYSAGGDAVNIAYGMTSDEQGNSQVFDSMTIIDSLLDSKLSNRDTQTAYIENMIQYRAQDTLVIDPVNGDGTNMSEAITADLLKLGDNYRSDYPNVQNHLNIPYDSSIQEQIFLFLTLPR